MEEEGLSPHIVLLGCGNMGGAILKTWLKNLSASYKYTIVTRSQETVLSFLDFPNVSWIEAGKPLLSKPHALLVAVKPQQVVEALNPYKNLEGCLCLSIAAGTPIKVYKQMLPNQAIIRLMPNMAAFVGESMTAAFTDFSLCPEDLEFVNRLLHSLGSVVWLDREHLFHGVTALSGSGSAYFFLLVEALMEAGLSQGLPKELVKTLAHQTLVGAGAFLKKSPLSACSLRRQVTSPGGTTEAALKELMEPPEINLNFLMKKAIEKAMDRSREIEKLNIYDIKVRV